MFVDHSQHQAISFISLLILGFATSLHCVGMCGPLSALWFQKNDPRKWRKLSEYYAGRWLSYLTFAYLAYFASQIIAVPYLIFALFVALILIFSLGSSIFSKAGISNRLFSFVKYLPLNKAYILGLVTGLLPCPLLFLLYAKMALAMNMFQVFMGVTAFFFGTLPLLLFAQLGIMTLFNRLSQKQRFILQIFLITTSLLLFYFHHSSEHQHH